MQMIKIMFPPETFGVFLILKNVFKTIISTLEKK